MKVFRQLNGIVLSSVFLTTLLGVRAEAGFQVRDLVEVKTVNQPRISPDGMRIVYIVWEVDLENDRSLGSLWMVDWDGGEPARLVDRQRVDLPRWSPDSKQVAFLSDRDDGEVKIWIFSIEDGRMWPVPMKGAGHGPISTHRYYSGLEWSPDGRRLAFAAQELKDPEDPFLWKDWYRTEGFGDIRRRVQIWTVEAEGGTPVQITSGDYHHGQPSWSPDGRHLVFMANRGGREEEILWSMNEDYDVWLVPATGGTPRELTSNVGPDIDPVWSSDGESIAFSSVGHQGSHGDVFHLKTIDVGTSEVTDLTGPPSFDYSVSLAPGSWVDGNIFFTAGVRTTSHVFRIEPGGGEPTAVTSGDRVASSVSVSADGRRLAFLLQDPTHPGDVWTSLSDGTSLRRLTNTNPRVDSARLATTEVVRWQSDDGMEVEGIVVKPAGFRPDHKYPLVVRPHGGPHGAVQLGFNAEYQVYAGHGYVVFAPNFRGSAGYGQPFLDADRGNLGGGDYLDLMSGVDHLIGLGYVDPARLVITGSSYGGFMTAWTVGHTNRFKAAMAGAPVVNAQSFFGTSDIPSWVTWEYLGPPWKYPDLIRAYSPISYVQHVKTPTLITHGAEDVRVPLSQGLEFYRSLRALGVPTEMVIYPGEQHGIGRPSHRMDRLQRTLDWFARYVSVTSD